MSRNSSLNAKEQQAATLQAFMEQHSLGEETLLQQDMVASYLQCSDSGPGAASVSGCLERMACMLSDTTISLQHSEREVAEL